MFDAIKTVVVKVGTSTLTSPNNLIDRDQVKNIVSEILWLLSRKIKVVLVSSGAVAAGMQVMGWKQRPKALADLQACAAVGQHKLMKIYEELFSGHGRHIAQVLLTADDLHQRQRYLNARNTLLTLMKSDILPVINENDTVATEEIKFGDNDKLSALVANLLEADMLIALSDVDGLYDQARAVITLVEEITPAISRLAGGTGKPTSLGGMRSKLEAARIVTCAGALMLIANGRTPQVIEKIFDGEDIGTVFLPHADKLQARKRWIAFSCRIKGRVIIDSGAAQAIARGGKSLLCSGVVGVEGNFLKGDMVSICEDGKKEIARGMVNYSAAELLKIKGKKTREIQNILGAKTCDEIIHRNDMVILDRK